jgi:competence protein ComEC
MLVCLLAACAPAGKGTQTTTAGTLSALPGSTSTQIPTGTITTPAPSPTNTQPPEIFTAIANLTPTVTPGASLKVYFIDVGQGDSILILSPDGKIILIDGGEADSGCLPFLKGLGVSHIDLMVATHPHSDHIGGLVQVLKAMPVVRVVTNGQISATPTFEDFLNGIANDKAALVIAKEGDTISEGQLSFAVLSPVNTSGDDLNHNSLVLRLVYGQVSFLFMGDADKAAEASMIAAGLVLPTTILKVGHHGSEYSSSPAFLALVHPAVAIYTAGIGNDYGHPKPVTLADLTAVGAQIYGTDVNGTITVTTDGQVYRVDIQKGAEHMPVLILPSVTP